VQKSTGRKNSQRLFIMAMSAMIVVAMFALKVFWGNIKRFFTGAKGKDRETDGNDR